MPENNNSENNRPVSRRRRTVTSTVDKVEKRGEGLGTGKVGNVNTTERPGSSGHTTQETTQNTRSFGEQSPKQNTTPGQRAGFTQNRPSANQRPSSGYQQGPNLQQTFSSNRTSRRRKGLPIWVFILVFLLVYFLLSGGLRSCSSSNNSAVTPTPTPTPAVQPTPTPKPAQSASAYSKPQTTYTNVNSSSLNTTVTGGAREKYTKLKGNGQDTVTIMLYMCASDLESNYGMATSDLNEILYAAHSDKVNIVIETGGTKRWRNSVMSTQSNQIWLVNQGEQIGLVPLGNVGSQNMADPNNLAYFIQLCAQNYPADRYMLILWDHGGGSVQGYAYDEVYNRGTMTLDKVYSALEQGGVKFDFIGFDACLMGTVETAVATTPFADYLIASEEVEPGTGWYYTNWLTSLANNTSIPTTEIGKQIIDDYTAASKQAAGRQAVQTTLSLVDLAEFDHLVPAALREFSKTVTASVKSDDYMTVAKARSVTKEFSQQNKLDQIDLAHFCSNFNSKEAKALQDAVLSCVKYNRTENIKNSYGLSIYFPYRAINKVSAITGIYDRIGMDSEYASAVRSFATLQSSGQAVSQNTTNNFFDILGGAPVSNGQTYSNEDILNLLLGSSGYDISSLLGGSQQAVDTDSLDLFSLLLGRNHLDASALELTEKNGETVLEMTDEQWKLVDDIYLNVWADDGTGYIDLGYDPFFEFNESGDLIVSYDSTWTTLNGHLVSYYPLANEEVSENEYTQTGFIPAILNNADGSQRVNLLVQFDQDNPEGFVLGAQVVYDDGVLAKDLIQVAKGDRIDFLCDFYDYNGNYQDTYYLGQPLTVSEGTGEFADAVFAEELGDDTAAQTEKGLLEVGLAAIENTDLHFCYMLRDVYGAQMWTPVQIASE